MNIEVKISDDQNSVTVSGQKLDFFQKQIKF
jgi:hypothetical protein